MPVFAELGVVPSEVGLADQTELLALLQGPNMVDSRRVVDLMVLRLVVKLVCDFLSRRRSLQG